MHDGYIVGDFGTDELDLINQCWKFYSYDSFTKVTVLKWHTLKELS